MAMPSVRSTYSDVVRRWQLVSVPSHRMVAPAAARVALTTHSSTNPMNVGDGVAYAHQRSCVAPGWLVQLFEPPPTSPVRPDAISRLPGPATGGPLSGTPPSRPSAPPRPPAPPCAPAPPAPPPPPAPPQMQI